MKTKIVVTAIIAFALGTLVALIYTDREPSCDATLRPTPIGKGHINVCAKIRELENRVSSLESELESKDVRMPNVRTWEEYKRWREANLRAQRDLPEDTPEDRAFFNSLRKRNLSGK